MAADCGVASLTDLLGLHSSCVLAAETQLSDGNIIKNDVKVFGSLKELPTHQKGHLENNIKPLC